MPLQPTTPCSPPARRSSLVGELHHLPHCNRLAALLDPLSLLRPGAQQASWLSMLDTATWQQAGPPMRDVLDGYELAAVVPVDSQGGGCEFVGGSVKLSGSWALLVWARQCARVQHVCCDTAGHACVVCNVCMLITSAVPLTWPTSCSLLRR